ncbi:hypothetical protein ACOMHN_037581 [Nucella lapillus]
MNMHEKWVTIVMFLAFCLYEKGYGADEELKCPDPFLENAVNTVTLKINTAAIKKAECDLKPTYLSFNRKRAGNNTSHSFPCIVVYNCSSPGPVSNPTPEKATCGCTHKTQEGIWTFEMKIYANKTKDTGAGLSFSLCSVPLNPPTRVLEKACTSMSFGSHGESWGCGVLCITVILIGVVVGIAIIVIIIVITEASVLMKRQYVCFSIWRNASSNMKGNNLLDLPSSTPTKAC